MLLYITFAADMFVTFLFTAEMIVKMHIRGIYKEPNGYFRDRWCRFDATMAFFLWTSVILQMFEMMNVAPQ